MDVKGIAEERICVTRVSLNFSGLTLIMSFQLEGENIPIGRVTQGAQGSLQASRMDPYSQPQAHSSRRDPAYAAPYGPRSESSYGARSESAYGRPATSDAGRSLPRAHL